MRIKDKVALVTGGAQGIGESIAIRFAEEGASIAIMDRDPQLAIEVANGLKNKGTDALALDGDVSVKASVQAAVDEVVSHFKRIDILVNNAGMHRMAEVTDIEEKTWDKIMAVNLKGCFLTVQAVVPHMREQNYGRIVNIASVSSYGQPPRQLHYNSSKAGVLGLTRSLALELARFNITVNAVAPGQVETAGARVFLEQYREQMERAVPLGRFAEPRDIANAVLFLVSDEADYITGQCLNICGGVSIGRAAG